jgi:hypothetical protein
MSLSLTDGAYLFCEPDWWKENGEPVNPGQHAWYPEWDKILGKAIQPRQISLNSEGVYMREFEKGWAVYVPLTLDSEVEVELPEAAQSVTQGKYGSKHRLRPGHGDLLLRKK